MSQLRHVRAAPLRPPTASRTRLVLRLVRAFALTSTTRRIHHGPGKEHVTRRSETSSVVSWLHRFGKRMKVELRVRIRPRKTRGFREVHSRDPCSRTSSLRAPSTWPMPSTDAGSFEARSCPSRPIPRGLQAALLEPNDEDRIAIRTTDFCYQTILTSTHDSCCYPRRWFFRPLRRSPSGDLHG